MVNKNTTVVIDRKNKTALKYASERDAFRATKVPKSTGWDNMNSGRAVNGRYEFYSVNSTPLTSK